MTDTCPADRNVNKQMTDVSEVNEHPETTAEAESLATGAGSADGTPAARRSAGGTPQRGRPVGHPGLCPPWVPALLSSTGSGRCGQTARGDTRVTQLRPAFLPPGNCYRDTYMRVIICIGDLFFFFLQRLPSFHIKSLWKALKFKVHRGRKSSLRGRAEEEGSPAISAGYKGMLRVRLESV